MALENASSQTTSGVDGRTRSGLILLTFGLAVVIVLGLFGAFFGTSSPEGFGWYLFSYAMGLTMIVLPCTFPLAFVIVPLSLGKGPMKGLGMALSFGIGVVITLSMYGVLAAIIGKTFIGALGIQGEVLKNWLYFIAGGIAYLFALGELGLIKFRMPTYSGAAPKIIQEKGDYLKALLLGLFLGNCAVRKYFLRMVFVFCARGCPRSATPASCNAWHSWHQRINVAYSAPRKGGAGNRLAHGVCGRVYFGAWPFYARLVGELGSAYIT